MVAVAVHAGAEAPVPGERLYRPRSASDPGANDTLLPTHAPPGPDMVIPPEFLPYAQPTYNGEASAPIGVTEGKFPDVPDIVEVAVLVSAVHVPATDEWNCWTLAAVAEMVPVLLTVSVAEPVAVTTPHQTEVYAVVLPVETSVFHVVTPLWERPDTAGVDDPFRSICTTRMSPMAVGLTDATEREVVPVPV